MDSIDILRGEPRCVVRRTVLERESFCANPASVRRHARSNTETVQSLTHQLRRGHRQRAFVISLDTVELLEVPSAELLELLVVLDILTGEDFLADAVHALPVHPPLFELCVPHGLDCFGHLLPIDFFRGLAVCMSRLLVRWLHAAAAASQARCLANRRTVVTLSVFQVAFGVSWRIPRLYRLIQGCNCDTRGTATRASCSVLDLANRVNTVIVVPTLRVLGRQRELRLRQFVRFFVCCEVASRGVLATCV